MIPVPSTYRIDLPKLESIEIGSGACSFTGIEPSEFILRSTGVFLC